MTRLRATRRWLVPLCLALLLAGVALPAVRVAAGTQVVTDCGDAGPQTLRGKIAAAGVGDTITFAQDCTITLAFATGTLFLNQDVTIDGTGHTVVIDGRCTLTGGVCTSGGMTVFEIAVSTTVTLNTLTIRHGGGFPTPGLGSVPGGAITNGGTLTVTNSTITTNLASDEGGGIGNSGTLTVTNTTISGNLAGQSGGGIWSDGPLTVTNSTISGNSASRASAGAGGGIYAQTGAQTVTNTNFTRNSALRGGALAVNIGGSLTLPITGGTFSANTASSFGGALYFDGGGAISVTGSVLTGNTAFDAGGGIANNGVTLTLASSTLSNNTASGPSGTGGGIYNIATTTVTGSTLSGNTAYRGGAIDNGDVTGGSGGTVTVTGSTLSGNTAVDVGGGIENACCVLQVIGSTLSGNSTTDGNNGGGGIDNAAHTVALITNSTLSGNAASGAIGKGGGLANGGILSVTNSTLSGNSAYVGGGSYNVNSLTVTNTVLAGNTATIAPDTIGTVTNGGHNLIGGNVLLAPLGNYGGATQTMPLLPGSPAIDAGDDAVCSTTTGNAPVNSLDQRGIARPQGTHCDTGAFESQGFTLTTTDGDGQSTAVSTAFAAPLVLTVASGHSEPVAGGQVLFTAPSGGAAATFAGNPATIGAAGSASVTATANGTAGGYSVTASAAGAPSVAFNLTNTAPTLTGISPSAGGTAGGTSVTLTGLGFGTTANTQVLLDGMAQPGASIVSVTSTQVIYVAPAHAVGNVTVTVTVNGTTLPGSATYTYLAVSPLPGAKPPGPAGGPPNPLPVVRPAGTTGGPAPNPLPAARP